MKPMSLVQIIKMTALVIFLFSFMSCSDQPEKKEPGKTQEQGKKTTNKNSVEEQTTVAGDTKKTKSDTSTDTKTDRELVLDRSDAMEAMQNITCKKLSVNVERHTDYYYASMSIPKPMFAQMVGDQNLPENPETELTQEHKTKLLAFWQEKLPKGFSADDVKIENARWLLSFKIQERSPLPEWQCETGLCNAFYIPWVCD